MGCLDGGGGHGRQQGWTGWRGTGTDAPPNQAGAYSPAAHLTPPLPRRAGIGYETARLLAAQGLRTVVAARSEELGQAAVQRLREGLAATPGSGSVEFARLDIVDHASVLEFAAWAGDALGGEIHILVNNADGPALFFWGGGGEVGGASSPAGPGCILVGSGRVNMQCTVIVQRRPRLHR